MVLFAKSMTYQREIFKSSVLYYDTSLQTHHMDSTLKRRGNGRVHVVSMWNPLGVFVGFISHPMRDSLWI